MPETAPKGLAEFRQLEPWPAAYRHLGRPREWLWTFDLPGEPAELWPFLADTSRTNRAVGLGEMHYTEKDGELHGWHRTAGVRHTFTEHWQWVAPERLELVRDYATGFVRLLRQIYLLQPRPGGSRFTCYHGSITRGALGPLALRIGMSSYEAKFRELVTRMSSATGRAPLAAMLREPPPDLDGDRRNRVSAIRAELERKGVATEIVAHLVDLVVSGDDLDLDRIRVRQLARDWNVEERPVLVAALHATRAGLLELTWDVMCPHCRGVRDKLPSLGDIPERSRCNACAVEFGTEQENSIEVTFRIHPSIRRLSEAVYCSAQPVKKPHIHLQQELGPGEAREVPTTLSLGRYRLRQRGQEDWATLAVAETGAGGQVIRWDAAALPDRLEVGPEPVLELHAGETSSTFVVEEVAWDGLALAPGQLFNLSEFRDLFSREHLAAGVKLHVGEQTILFTDIVGSTMFYATSGDPVAFLEVKKHFAQVYEAVSSSGGAVVKTIGDAVMAAFSDPVASVRAAAEIHRRFPAAGDGPALRLRASINTGPCIAVNLNSGIDYFGGTVNTAAKLQRLADAGEVALRDTVMRAPGVAGAIRQLGGPAIPKTMEHDALGTLHATVWRPPA